ncbi:hypothetical protein KAR91_44700 [Candidatus Pacearchaeota archaeon]|nr:hypothetical protein [Candidatus Pacearchaeota archaeon]
MGIIDSYHGTEEGTAILEDNPVGENFGQAFRMGGTNQDIVSAKYRLIVTIGGGADSITLAAKIYACTGTPGTDGMQTGSALASSDEIVYTDDVASAFVTFTFSSPYTLLANTNYCLVLECTAWAEDTISMARTSFDMSSPTHDGNRCYCLSGTPGYNADEDHNFYAYSAGWAGKIIGVAPGKYIDIASTSIGKIIGV